jgi:lipopolysaccharide export LptBFGC system permease protein LptF
MALHDYERRKLNEIERQLAEENPLLAQRFAGFRPITDAAVVAALPILVMVAFAGLVLIEVGAQLAAPVPIILGALVITGVPATAGWYLLRRGRTPGR